MRPQSLRQLVRAGVLAWSEDYASSMGAALAFYAALSLAPVLLVAIVIASLLDTAPAQHALVAAAAEMLQGTGQPRATGVLAAALGVTAFLVAASALFGELQDALNRIWRAPLPRPPGLLRIIRERLPSFLMIVGLGALLLAPPLMGAALCAPASSAGLGKAALPLLAINFGLGFALSTVSFALIYKLIPRVAVEWHDVRTGAVLAALPFSIGSMLLGVYLGRAAIASTFGAALLPVLLLLWMYFSAQIFLFGAEFTRAHARARVSRRTRPQAEPAMPIPNRTGAAAPQEAPILVRPWPYEIAAKRAVPNPRGAH